MSYCRFRNTLSDLRDCEQHFGDTLKNREEEEARKRLVALCKQIVENYGEDFEQDN